MNKEEPDNLLTTVGGVVYIYFAYVEIPDL